MLVDSHCHLNMLDLAAYDGSLDALIQQAEKVGVAHLLCVSVDIPHGKEVVKIAQAYPNISASVGIHPSEKLEQEPTVDTLVELAQQDKVVALGETGLDYHYNDSGLDAMRERFRCHIRAAHQVGKPIIIHSRDAKADTIQIMQEEQADQVGGVMHCFTEDWAMAEQALALNFYISISGIVTFKNAGQVAEVAQKVPLDRLLIETDSPYLAPVPYRGKQNEPQYVKLVAEKIAELRGVSSDVIAKHTTENFARLFAVNL